MIINEIEIQNFRIYKGHHKVVFNPSAKKNVFVISGDNGFGKTTILTSLVWCLYGKLMSDVDEKFKREISESLGYKQFAKSNLNKLLSQKSIELEISDSERHDIRKDGYQKNSQRHDQIQEVSQYSVSLIISGVLLPTVPCEKLTIRRTYDIVTEKETVCILVDGKENELTKEVGPEIFINDFILSRDIAKFFFFDSEKIVTLAEMKSLEDKRKLSTAYSEVLGIKKYEDLKNNLENLRIKFRRKSADLTDRDKLNKLIKECDELNKLINLLKSNQVNNDLEILNKRQISEQFQEKLIREGNGISINELLSLKVLRDELKAKDVSIKNKIKELLELAPFAISGKKFLDAYNSCKSEQSGTHNQIDVIKINEKVLKIRNELIEKLQFDLDLSNSKINSIIQDVFKNHLVQENITEKSTNLLFDFTPKEIAEFQSIYENLKFSYNHIFRQLVKEDRNNKIFLTKTLRKISLAEASDNDIVVKEIRLAKSKTDKAISDLEKENRRVSEEIGSYQKELTIKNKLKTELSKKVSVDESDRFKDEVAGRLISELEDFITKLKIVKKKSLEFNIKRELSRLMHKTNFIDNVVVDIQGDIIDINLYDIEGVEIKKERLSKGEQQLYATAILKALVDESEIKFPVFIDSPLQKFDRKHSNKIITEFYPNVSEQVVVFPLLGKELSSEEYSALLPTINKVYLIQNKLNCSQIEEMNPKEIFQNT